MVSTQERTEVCTRHLYINLYINVSLTSLIKTNEIYSSMVFNILEERCHHCLGVMLEYFIPLKKYLVHYFPSLWRGIIYLVSLDF